MVKDKARFARAFCGALATALLCLTAASPAHADELRTGTLPPIRHVFLIVLENKSFDAAFGPGSPAPYLAKTLRARGALLTHYYATGHWSLDNYIALVSGQAPNPATQRDCPQPVEFQPTRPGLDEHGQVLGVGCVYPAIVKTLPDQLEQAGFTWKGFMEDLDSNPTRDDPQTCTGGRIGKTDETERAAVGDQYAAKHDPFVYFHTILDDPARCAAHIVSLHELRIDLRRVATTPNYSFITPNLCNDGHDLRCVDGKTGGLAGINGFLQKWVPVITRSPAFRKDGLLIITFDESDGAASDAFDACCNEQPLSSSPDQPGLKGPGGGRIGAVLLSPYIRPGTVSAVPYNHYSLLRTVEDIFDLGHLGYAAEPGLSTFGPDVFTRR
ncbi:MAG TPA: alkaline phosphatase family protein [Steroidobacteraceae bacterium]|nr:alkaline phosphatase family protein [Steroidobacteraceae bacterium]